MNSGLSVDGIPAFYADTMQVEVSGDFDRVPGSDNEREAVATAFRAIGWALAHFRSLTRATFVRTPDDFSSWSLRYLDDASNELEHDPDLVRGAGKTVRDVGPRVWLGPEVWGDIAKRPATSSVPASDEMLMDAYQVWPHIGASIVLAATAVETRIATALDILASEHPERISAPFWEWVTDRGDYRKDPSVEEKLTDLVALLIGVSLKKESALWDAYCQLRKARNSFVHKGVAVLLDKTPVSREKAHELIRGAEAIVSWIEQFLPEGSRTPKVAQPTRRFEHLMPLGRVE